MTTIKSNAKAALVTVCNALIAGITGMPDPTYLLGGQTLTKAEVIAPLKAFVDSAAKSAAEEATWHTSLQQERVDEAAARLMIDALKPFLQGRLGKASPLLQSQFGLPPQKKPQKTVAAKATGIAKSKATRVIRGTRGAKQKKALTTQAAPAAVPPKPAV